MSVAYENTFCVCSGCCALNGTSLHWAPCRIANHIPQIMWFWLISLDFKTDCWSNNWSIWIFSQVSVLLVLMMQASCSESISIILPSPPYRWRTPNPMNRPGNWEISSYNQGTPSSQAFAGEYSQEFSLIVFQGTETFWRVVLTVFRFSDLFEPCWGAVMHGRFMWTTGTREAWKSNVVVLTAGYIFG